MSNSQQVKRAVISNNSNDLEDFQIMQLEHNGKTTEAELLVPYGLVSNPPADTMVTAINVMGQEENKVCFASAGDQRARGQLPGTVGIHNPFTQDHIIMTPDGGTIVTLGTGAQIIISPDAVVTIAGDLTVAIAGGVTIGIAGDVTFNANGGGNVILNGNYAIGGLGGKPIARVGDAVQIGTQVGTIISGSTLHTAT